MVKLYNSICSFHDFFRNRSQKFVGRRLSHRWVKEDGNEAWFKGVVLSLQKGKDGENEAEYEIKYEGHPTPYLVNHLVEDFYESSVKFLDL